MHARIEKLHDLVANSAMDVVARYSLVIRVQHKVVATCRIVPEVYQSTSYT